MNCPVCGGAYVMGGRSHKECRDKQEQDARWKQEVDDRLESIENRLFLLERGY